MNGTSGPDGPTGEIPENRLFPEPVAVISMRDAVTYRDVDEDGQPILIITDGVTTVALDSGLSGLSFGVVAASHRLADAVQDFAQSITARWRERGSTEAQERGSTGARMRRGTGATVTRSLPDASAPTSPPGSPSAVAPVR